ncbi:MAG TPA: hypothetical protein IAC31_04355 [Candidatus Faecousia intestinigallinarum]|nr:hypothetical protein [Candidatus Faecousia intestinigallinarum]
MKKIIGFVMALLLLTAVGCTNSQETDDTSSQQTDGVSYMETEGAEESQAATEASSEGRSDGNETEPEVASMRISVKSEDYEVIYELNDSLAASQLYAQLPLTVEVEPFSNNEMTFYPEALSVEDAPLSDGEPGSLSYYAPWGDVVMFYAPCTPNRSLYELGTVVSGEEHIANLSGTITVSAVE